MTRGDRKCAENRKTGDLKKFRRETLLIFGVKKNLPGRAPL